MSNLKKIDSQQEVAALPTREELLQFPHTPARGHLAIWLEPAGKISEGGVVLPDTVRQVKDYGLVVAVGPARITGGVEQPQDYAPGDKVQIGQAPTTSVSWKGQAFVIIADFNVILKLEE